MPLVTGSGAQGAGLFGSTQGAMPGLNAPGAQMNLSQLLRGLMGLFGGRGGGMAAPGAASITALQRGGQPMQGGPQPTPANQSLTPSVEGAPQVENPLADMAPAAAGGTVPMGNLLSASAVQRRPRANFSNQNPVDIRPYGGGLARYNQTRWTRRGPTGPVIHSLRAE